MTFPIKTFARWLYMKTHRSELIQAAKLVKGHMNSGAITKSAQALGALDTLEILDLLVRD